MARGRDTAVAPISTPQWQQRRAPSFTEPRHSGHFGPQSAAHAAAIHPSGPSRKLMAKPNPARRRRAPIIAPIAPDKNINASIMITSSVK
jgi:hypothetical protein